MPAWALPLILQAGKFLLEYAQKNWTGEPYEAVIEIVPGTPCTVDCKKLRKERDAS